MGKSYSESSSDDEAERTIFVNGLAYESTEDDIKHFFGDCGEIERVNLPKYQDSERNIGYCHVRFDSKDGRRKAMRLDGKYLNHRYLKIEKAKGHKAISKFFCNLEKRVDPEEVDSVTIFVKNLPYDSNEDEIGDFFSQCGKIQQIRMVYNSVHEHFKGYKIGFIG